MFIQLYGFLLFISNNDNFIVSSNQLYIVQSAGAVEYTDCFSVEW